MITEQIKKCPGTDYRENTHIIQMRVAKTSENQMRRTRDKCKAEVFTLSWVVNQQNDMIDDAWFGVSATFNLTEGKTWKTIQELIVFLEGKLWKIGKNEDIQRITDDPDFRERRMSGMV